MVVISVVILYNFPKVGVLSYNSTDDIMHHNACKIILNLSNKLYFDDKSLQKNNNM